MYGECAGAYRKAEVFTSDPRKLIIMCYERAIGNLKLAREYYEAREYEKKAKALQKTYDIINELLMSLNFEKGGIIAVNLDALYKFMIKQLTIGDLNRDLKAFDQVIVMLEELESAWKGIPSAQPHDSQPAAKEASNYRQKDYPAAPDIKTEKRVSA